MTADAESIVQYLTAVTDMMARTNKRFEGWAYTSHHQMILDCGQPFERKPLPHGFRRMKAKECFSNAFYCVTKHAHDRYQYVEGYAAGLIPTEHAWVLDTEDGKIFDPTWPNDDSHTEYYGIVFPTRFVTTRIIEQGYYGLIPNDWKHGNDMARIGPSLWECKV